MNGALSNGHRPQHRVLIDIGHPAHVHLFRNLVLHLKKNSIPYVIASREKELTNRLLDHYDLSHVSISKQAQTLTGQLIEFIVRTFRILRLHHRHHFTLALGTSVSIGFLSLFTMGKVKSINFCEDDDDVVPLQALLAYPFSTKIVNPDCIRFKRWKSKRILVSSYHELAYLHPDNFQPDPEIPEKYGLETRRYIILRLSSLKAHHDRNEQGISPDLLQTIREIARDYNIVESRELSGATDIEPWDMHHGLALAKLLISDSQTMTAEAALLGTPSIRISTFKGRLSYLEEIEKSVDHAFSFLPQDTDAIIQALNTLIHSDVTEGIQSSSRDRLLHSKTNLTSWMISNLIEG